MNQGHVKKIRITTWRIVVLASLNLSILVHYYVWHVQNNHTAGHSDPREFFDFFRTGVARPFAVLFLVVTALTPFMGRTFCGWFCHMGSWQDAARFVGDRKWKRFIPLHSIGTLFLPAFCLSLPIIGIVRYWIHHGFPTSLSFEWSDIPVLDVTAEGVVISLFLLVLLNQAFFGTRAICRFFCPLGLWLKFFDAFSRMRVRRTLNTPCDPSCLQCNIHCRMGVDINYQINRYGEVRDLQCIKCGTCTVYCAQQKLRLGRRPLGADVILFPDHAPNKQRWVKMPIEWVIHLAAVILIITSLPEILDGWELALMKTCIAIVSTYVLFSAVRLFYRKIGKFYKEKARPHGIVNG